MTDEEKHFRALEKELEKDQRERLKALRKEMRMMKAEAARAEREAHKRGEYTESDYQKDLELYLQAVQKQR